jgi:hypothetical protein
MRETAITAALAIMETPARIIIVDQKVNQCIESMRKD